MGEGVALAMLVELCRGCCVGLHCVPRRGAATQGLVCLLWGRQSEVAFKSRVKRAAHPAPPSVNSAADSFPSWPAFYASTPPNASTPARILRPNSCIRSDLSVCSKNGGCGQFCWYLCRR